MNTKFIPFIMAGYPDKETTLAAIFALAEAGADIIELGVPFSDPIADGPINQLAAEIALKNGINLDCIFEMVETVRNQNCNIPIILFSYLNPIFAYGYERFAKRAKEAGVNGILIVDLPPEENSYAIFQNAGLEIVLLASPTTQKNRYPLYQRLKPSFVYYISRLAVTGIQHDVTSNLELEIKELRSHLPNSKIVVGFGISTPDQARQIAAYADGVVVGSVLVKTLGENFEAFKQLIREFVTNISCAG